MKTLHCRDAGFDCNYIIHANTEAEVLNQASKHVTEVHGITINEEMVEQVKALIIEEEEKIE
ncbi:MAG: DUF1059 domain-containing protein [Parafilimonas sp.]